jgi:UDP-4-amino-4,6-dideoxy-N-acetyl-beta-L-altrosamine N-acetyltransferase
MIAADLEAVLVLRNRIEVRRYMLTQHEISNDEHLLWFKRSSRNPNKKLLVLEIEKKCCGFVQFEETKYPGVSDWGFYTDPDSPKGTGKMLGIYALAHAFENEGVYKICGQALNNNLPSIEFHKSLGFAQEGIFRNHHFDGLEFHDLICFGIHKSEFAKECA